MTRLLLVICTGTFIVLKSDAVNCNSHYSILSVESNYCI